MQEELRNGCTSFTGLVIQPLSLLIDGDDFLQNVPGAIPTALRSVISLGGPAQVQENFAIGNIDFTRDEVEEILSIWKEMFFDVSIKIMNDTHVALFVYYLQLVLRFNRGETVTDSHGKDYRKATNDDIYGWTSDTIDDLTDDLSQANIVLIFIGYVLMIIYSGIAFLQFDWVHSHVSVGLVSSLLYKQHASVSW